MPHPSPTKHAVFSFFSGAGFLDLGFEAAGFETVFANEINKEFVEGYIHSREKLAGGALKMEMMSRRSPLFDPAVAVPFFPPDFS